MRTSVTAAAKASASSVVFGAQEFARVEGFELVDLVDVVTSTSNRKSVIEIHVGEQDDGDVVDAFTLQEAVNKVKNRATAKPVASTDEKADFRLPSLTCSVSVHEERDHNLVIEMRDTGELHELLCRVVQSEPVASQSDLMPMPERFVGFKDCDDF